MPVLTISIGADPDWHFWVKSLVPILAACLTVLVAILGFRNNRSGELEREKREQAVRQKNDRASMFGELARVHEIAVGQRRYMTTDKLRFIWVPVFDSLMPSAENRARLENLSIPEVKALTTFLFSYQEHICYIAASADRTVGPEMGLTAKAIGYDYSSDDRRAWLDWSLNAIERKASEALTVLGKHLDEADKAEIEPTRAGKDMIATPRQRVWRRLL